ncbi:MAG: protein kinase [Planctomycetes bacterium]|nr:protein kinase [Planctomycetota bacterium]
MPTGVAEVSAQPVRKRGVPGKTSQGGRPTSSPSVPLGRSLPGPASIGDAVSTPDATSGSAGDHYELLEEIGRGGMGVVLKARDVRLHRLVAIKRISPSLAGARRILERFFVEARTIARLSHFNIVHVYEVGQDAEGAFLAMELVTGGSLRAHLREQQRLPVDRALELVAQLLDALVEAHATGVFHRDIKPDNILLTDRGVPKLVDFGLAKDVEAGPGLSREAAQLGTPVYSAPEQFIDASQVDGRADLYALGMTLYEMVAGRSPRHVRLDALPPTLRPILLKLVAENPNDRYADASEALAAVREFREAAARADLASEHRGDTIARLAEHGYRLLRERNLVEAAGVFDRLLQSAPSSVEAKAGNLAILFARGELDRAHALYTELAAAGRENRYVARYRRLVEEFESPVRLAIEPAPLANAAGACRVSAARPEDRPGQVRVDLAPGHGGNGCGLAGAPPSARPAGGRQGPEAPGGRPR